MSHAAAENAVLIGQVRSFLAWIGDGRKLTQTGRIGLADARHLVDSLGTGDKFDQEIGDRVFKTKSSEELVNLNRLVEWAKAARLVRVTGARLAVVKKNAALADKPLDLVLALLAAYPKLGKVIFPRNTWRNSSPETISPTSARGCSPPCSAPGGLSACGAQRNRLRHDRNPVRAGTA